MRHMTQMEAHQHTVALIREHQLYGWTVKYGYAKRRAGLADYRKKVITLSKYLMAQRSYEDTMNTITHEIAHAIVGAGHGHDHVWARQHRALGGDGKRCFEHVDEQAPWIGKCQHGCKAARYRAPKRLEGWRCGKHRAPLTWERNAA